jgi:peptidylprolyl isomerase
MKGEGALMRLAPAARLAAALPVLACGLAAGGLLAGCSGGGSGSGPVPVITGPFGSAPVIAMPKGNPPGQLIVHTLIQGGGPVVAPDDYVLFNVEGKVWAGDREVVDSFADHQPQGLPLALSGVPAWKHLAGARVGSRVLMVVPPKEGFGAAGDPQASVTSGDTLVFVFDILAALPAGAHVSGTPVPYRPGRRLPSVRMTADGPVITVPSKVSPPRSLVSRLLIRGHGRPVVNGDTVVVQYTGVVWRTGKVFGSSWTRRFPEAFQLGAGQVIPGWERGLGGMPAGSRVLLIVPPALGYGKSGDPPYVAGTDTLVFVVDIVGAIQ